MALVEEKADRVLVFGCSGRVARQVLTGLHRRKIRAAATTRSLSLPLVGFLSSVGLEEDCVFEGTNVELPHTYATALNGCTKLFLATPHDSRMVRMSKLLVDAAEKAGIKHIVKLSIIGAKSPTGRVERWHQEVEEYIKNKAMSWTFVRASWFCESVALFSGKGIEEGQMRLAMGEARISWIAASDIGEVCAEIFSDTTKHQGKCYTLTGSEVLSCPEVAYCILKEVGKEIVYVDASSEEIKKNLKESGFDSEWIEGMLEWFQATKRGEYSIITNDVETILKRSPISFREYVTTNRSSLVKTLFVDNTTTN